MKFILLVLFILSCSLTYLLQRYAHLVQLIDVPNQRSSHARIVPRGGGLAIICTFFIATLYLVNKSHFPLDIALTVWFPAFLVAGIGLVDDLGDISAGWRIAVHSCASILFLYLLSEIPSLPIWHGQTIQGPVLFPVYFIGLVWALNLFNFMDGIDGLAAVEALTLAGGGGVILFFRYGETLYSAWLFLFFAVIAGFLVWNWAPAKIFMGDVCSGFLGFFFASSAILLSVEAGMDIWIWVILGGVFLVDATVTLLQRIIGGEKVYEAHRNHTYQIMSRRWGSHAKVTVAVFVINLLWLFPLALLTSYYPGSGLLISCIALLPLVLVALKTGAGKENNSGSFDHFIVKNK